MTSPAVPEVLRTQFFTVSSGLDADELFQLMRDFEASREGHASGLCWEITADPDDWGADCLVVGVRGDVGALEWYGATSCVPASDLNADGVEYYTFDGHVRAVHPGAEVDVETVRRALREFLTTGEQPTSVAWREFDPYQL
ncbi:Imm1 family immunity protein [Saccharopolyspora flava]|uniref:Immunity protein Imm1 n=1 Tax=Saccharopolyspora flava TaxID=95161 RepID=A0A1I6PM90_9PSEU|nr:Imm1 family immunity protein [Saccharopolyspora flava]SFS41333.1 Immunity protein Imm1 [Saccharopolyspora flava]